MECNIRDVTSGVPQKACWGEFSIVIYGNMAYVQTDAASHTGEIPSYLDTDPEFQHWPFNIGSLEGVGREFAPASLLRHPRRDVTYSAHILMLVGKVYCTSELNIHESGLNTVFLVFPTVRLVVRSLSFHVQVSWWHSSSSLFC